ncbi:M2 family metallopeptidase [Lacipirellula sp.]|uniref:M2 family metallopeptidase n=1 Tax=Lacipirellula sp. TaxID=2691419 RepID=UPI003D11E6B4
MDDDSPLAACGRRTFLALTGASLYLVGSRGVVAGESEETPEQRAQKLLEKVVGEWRPLDLEAGQAGWLARTDVSDAHDEAVTKASEALDRYLGSPEIIEPLQELLEHPEGLAPATVRQLKKLHLMCAEVASTIADTVSMRSQAATRQQSLQNGFVYRLSPEGLNSTITLGEIDKALTTSTSLPIRRAVWDSSKQVGEALRSNLLWLRELRNRVAREVGFDSYFALQVADYGMTVDEMTSLTDGFVADLRPLYEQLHTWAKYQLAVRYGVDPPEGLIPAHWFPNRWAQNWPGLVDAINLDAPFAGKPKEFIIQQAEAFYRSLGFDALPPVFHEKSDLYPVPAGQSRRKNGHASAWHMDRDQEVRCLMSIEPNSFWFTTAHHELGHIYYYLAYSKAWVPILLRAGANRAFHEGVGDLIGLAASQPTYLSSIGLLPEGAPAPEAVEWLLEPALNKTAVAFLLFAAGTMTQFEKQFYAGEIPDGALNRAWWELAGRYQGIAPPGPRGEQLCDAATKTHINDDAALYYDYAIGTIIKFQLHNHIAKNILQADPQNCNYFGNKEVGKFLRSIFEVGATQDWRDVLKSATGEELSAKPMLDYFAPLMVWLQEQNRGRAVGW